jgi:hypothetical protein
MLRGGRYVHDDLVGVSPGGAALPAPAAGPSPALVTAGATRVGHDANGHETNGHETNGHETNGHETNGHETNGGEANVWDGDGDNGYREDGNGPDSHARPGNGHATAVPADGLAGEAPASPAIAGRISQADGSPAGGAAVTLIDDSGRQAGRSNAEPDGTFRIAAPDAGLYTLIAMAAAHQPEASAVQVGETPVQHDVTLKGSSELAGTARTGEGRTIGDARVMLLDPNGNLAGVTTTGPDGSYSFGDLAPGEYTVVASGYPPVAQALRLAPGEPLTHDPILGHPES